MLLRQQGAVWPQCAPLGPDYALSDNLSYVGRIDQRDDSHLHRVVKVRPGRRTTTSRWQLGVPWYQHDSRTCAPDLWRILG